MLTASKRRHKSRLIIQPIEYNAPAISTREIRHAKSDKNQENPEIINFFKVEPELVEKIALGSSYALFGTPGRVLFLLADIKDIEYCESDAAKQNYLKEGLKWGWQRNLF